MKAGNVTKGADDTDLATMGMRLEWMKGATERNGRLPLSPSHVRLAPKLTPPHGATVRSSETDESRTLKDCTGDIQCAGH